MNEGALGRKRRPLHTKILIGLVLGAIVGILAQTTLGSDQSSVKWIRDQIADPVGKIFLNFIFMIVVPLLFSALVLGVAEIGDARKVGRVGVRALALTVVLSGIAVGIGITAVNWVQPGKGIPTETVERLKADADQASAAKSVEQAQQAKGVGETIVDMVPRNPLDSAVKALEGGLLPFMVFALIFGLALCAIEPEKALPVKSFLEGLFAVSLKIIDFAMKLAPIGVFALAYKTASVLGWSALLALSKYAILVLVCLAIHLFIVYPIFLRWVAKRNPREFFRQIKEVMVTAFGTSSSNATLPTALRVSVEEVGIPRKTSSFVLTVGATANQNGTALFEGITILFLAQFFGVDLSLGQQLTVMGLAILAGVGTAGVPGGAWPMIALILIKIGVPPEAIGICLGIDRILDMSRTVVNVVGDITIAACVSSQDSDSEIPDEALA
ncbi:MAG TPA: dicarboxylate/amino acid:cation symporter [Fimbriimonadaceae bacterium]|nr:dicarboxylate/amino acid:cation symporter [Fimbriimonadaceae bacterium]HRJ31972.1 dicarboxylate/amino acid:cation symporter [Fimbriimonadaceae bacterium]